METNKKKKPQTPREWALYRAKMSCDIGLEAIEGKIQGVKTENDHIVYAIICLLKSVKEIATAMEERDGNE